MKLYSILFESVGESDILNLIKQIINSDTETGDRIKRTFLFPMRDNNRDVPITELLDKLVKDIYDQNKDQFDRMFKDADKVKYLDAGSIGVAFDLGDRILKIEEESKALYNAGERAEKAATALYPEPKNKPKVKEPAPYKPGDNPFKTVREDVDRNIGKYVPMIYDKGVIKYNYEGIEVSLNWIIMEKFETLNAEDKMDMDGILASIIGRITDGGWSLEEIKDITNYRYVMQEEHRRLGSKLRLKNGWFPDLVQGMWELNQKGITDFHAGNIGIRRTGGEGSLVFFD